MIIYSDELEFETRGEFDVRDLTPRLVEVVRRSGVKEGLLHIYSGHATGILILNEYEPSLIEDIKKMLSSPLRREIIDIPSMPSLISG